MEELIKDDHMNSHHAPTFRTSMRPNGPRGNGLNGNEGADDTIKKAAKKAAEMYNRKSRRGLALP
jgi:hypothetical protein